MSLSRGDLVVVRGLPSSPTMLITRSHSDGFMCIWFTSDGELLSSFFETDVLESYHPFKFVEGTEYV